MMMNSSSDMPTLDPVHEADTQDRTGSWTQWLIAFLRVMAAISMIKGLYHWARVCGIGGDQFEYHSIAWQSATVFFAVLDLVAAVGLWLAAAWGAVVWLMSVASMLVLEIFFPQVFGASVLTGVLEAGLLGLYLYLAIMAAQEHPP